MLIYDHSGIEGGVYVSWDSCGWMPFGLDERGRPWMCEESVVTREMEVWSEGGGEVCTFIKVLQSCKSCIVLCFLWLSSTLNPKVSSLLSI